MSFESATDSNPLHDIRRRGVQVKNEELPVSEEFGDADLIELSIDDIKPFNLNPRRSPNPRYADIKDSIFNDGLMHPPNVTRRSSSEPWIIADGGNTRLEILQELRDEAVAAGNTANIARFSKIVCRKKTWTSERKTIGFHVSENDLRGGMLFIDKAIAFSDILDDAFPDTDWRELTQSEKASAVCDSGWFIRQDHVSRYQQVLEYKDTLSRYLNRQGKPGQRAVGRSEFGWVIALHKKYLSIAKASHASDMSSIATDIITNTWRDILALHDSETLNTPPSQRLLKRDMNTKLSQKLSIPVEDIEAIIFDINPEDGSSSTHGNTDQGAGKAANKTAKSSKKTRSKLIDEFRIVFAAISEKIDIEHTIDPDSGLPVAISPAQPIDAAQTPERAMAYLSLYLQSYIAAGQPVLDPTQIRSIDGSFAGSLTHDLVISATHRAMIVAAHVADASQKSLHLNLAQLEQIALDLCASTKRSRRGQ